MRTIVIHYLPEQTIVALCGEKAPGHYLDLEANAEQVISEIPHNYEDPNTFWIPCGECLRRRALVDLDGTTL